MSETSSQDRMIGATRAQSSHLEIGTPASVSESSPTGAFSVQTKRPSQWRESSRTTTVKLDAQDLELAGYLTPSTMRTRLAEQYRIIKRPILKQASSQVEGQDTSRVIAVTSCLPGEGKTFTVFNLAMSLAMERDVSVLVIDADLLGRAYTHRLHLSDRPGLSDILLDHRRVPAEVMVTLDVGHLAVIPAGRAADHPSELISSDRMRDVIRHLAASYRDSIILLDTAPLMITSQAAVISDLVGQLLIVVEEGATPQQAVLDALSIISGNCSVGLVLNKSRLASRGEDWPYYGGA